EALWEWLLELRQQYPAARVGLCLEQPAVHLIGFLESYPWITLHPINPITLQKYREAFVTSRAKDDTRDVALEAKAALDLKTSEVVADKGYYNAAEVSRCVDRGITPFIARADTSANTAQGLFGKSKFHYDEQKDVYVCPAGQPLTYRFETYELGRGLRYYRARGCKDCALKKQCTRNKSNRTLTREENEHLMEAMAARVKAQPQKMKLRKQLCEHPFGTIKRALGYDHFLLKGLEKVRAEWSLITLIYNLKRVLNLVSFEKLMAAVS